MTGAAKQILKVTDLKKHFPVRSAGFGILSLATKTVASSTVAK